MNILSRLKSMLRKEDSKMSKEEMEKLSKLEAESLLPENRDKIFSYKGEIFH